MTRFENDKSDDHPLVTQLGEGTYSWCQCGKTKTVPYCDGSHEGTGISPLAFEAKGPGASSVCNCGLTFTPPYCDGSHVTIE
jgi:CDGSH-type Zn-finger protein